MRMKPDGNNATLGDTRFSSTRFIRRLAEALPAICTRRGNAHPHPNSDGTEHADANQDANTPCSARC